MILPIAFRIITGNGACYAEAGSEAFDPLGPNNSQGYIAHVNTRALIFIEADEPAIGLLCFVAVGKAEVSSCVVGVKEGQHVDKGEEIGFFQFGGSLIVWCSVLGQSRSLHYRQPPREKIARIRLSSK